MFGKNPSVEEIHYALFTAKVYNDSECINNEAVFNVIEKVVGCEPMEEDLFHGIVWIKTAYLASSSKNAMLSLPTKTKVEINDEGSLHSFSIGMHDMKNLQTKCEWIAGT